MIGTRWRSSGGFSAKDDEQTGSELLIAVAEDDVIEIAREQVELCTAINSSAN